MTALAYSGWKILPSSGRALVISVAKNPVSFIEIIVFFLKSTRNTTVLLYFCYLRVFDLILKLADSLKQLFTEIFVLFVQVVISQISCVIVHLSSMYTKIVHLNSVSNSFVLSSFFFVFTVKK